MKKYKFIDTYELTMHYFSINEILEIINRDRNVEWIDYEINDWKEGVEHFTNYSLKECENDANR